MKEQPKIVEITKQRREIILRWLKKGTINVDELSNLPYKRITDNMTEEEAETELHRLCTLIVDREICQRLISRGKCLKYCSDKQTEKPIPSETY